METETLATIDDPDLGRLDLVRESFQAQGAGDSDWEELPRARYWGLVRKGA